MIYFNFKAVLKDNQGQWLFSDGRKASFTDLYDRGDNCAKIEVNSGRQVSKTNNLLE